MNFSKFFVTRYNTLYLQTRTGEWLHTFKYPLGSIIQKPFAAEHRLLTRMCLYLRGSLIAHNGISVPTWPYLFAFDRTSSAISKIIYRLNVGVFSMQYDAQLPFSIISSLASWRSTSFASFLPLRHFWDASAKSLSIAALSSDFRE